MRLGHHDDLHALVGVVRRSAVFCNLVADRVATVNLEPRPPASADAGISTCIKRSDVVSLQWVAHILHRLHSFISRAGTQSVSKARLAHLYSYRRVHTASALCLAACIPLVQGALRSLSVTHLEAHLLLVQLSL